MLSFSKQAKIKTERKTALKLFDKYLKELDRLDGDGLCQEKIERCLGKSLQKN
jgi:hypothetical protein